MPATERTTLRRHPERSLEDAEQVEAILDEALVCHLGFLAETGPVVVPTTYARTGDTLYVHGALASRMLRSLAGGIEVCLTVTLLDGLVLAASHFGHSMNYRSVMVFGRAREVTEGADKAAALTAIVEHVVPGRAVEARPPTRQELDSTTVLALDLREVSAKVRSGPPQDPEADRAWPVWTGEIPLRLVPGAPLASPVSPLAEAPAYATGYARPGAGAPESGSSGGGSSLVPRPPLETA